MANQRNYSPWRGWQGFNPRRYPYSQANRQGRFAMPNWVGGADPAYVPTPYEEEGRFGPMVDMDIWRALIERMNQEVTQPRIKRGYTKKKRKK